MAPADQARPRPSTAATAVLLNMISSLIVLTRGHRVVCDFFCASCDGLYTRWPVSPSICVVRQLSLSATISSRPTPTCRVVAAQEDWDYSDQGLTSVGAALVALAVSTVTGGMGTSIAGAIGFG